MTDSLLQSVACCSNVACCSSVAGQAVVTALCTAVTGLPDTVDVFFLAVMSANNCSCFHSHVL